MAASRAAAGHPLAVVTGADHPTGLGSGRALHRAGARVFGLTRAPAAPPCRSRVWRTYDIVQGDGGASWIDALKRLAQRLERPAYLLPTQDHVVAEISRRRQELSDGYRFVLPEDEVVQTFLEKTRFYDWAGPLGLPLPASRVVNNDAELRAALRDMPYPLILKPLYRTPAWDKRSPVEKVLRLDAARDIEHLHFDPFATVSSLILSQWIEGPDSAVHYCLAYCSKAGEVQVSFTGRKLLQYPRQTGSTAICVGTENGEVRELTEETFRLARFRGMGSLEVKYGADNRPYITEPTVGRPNLQSYSAVAAGCNLHAAAMCDALGLEWRRERRRNCWWMEEGAVLELLTSRSVHPVPWRLLAREAVRAHRFGGAYWTWWDPAPFIALLRRKAGGLIRRIKRR